MDRPVAHIPLPWVRDVFKLISKRLCAGACGPEVRAPSPRTQKPHSAAQNSCYGGFCKGHFLQGDRLYPGCAGLRPACLEVLLPQLISKWLSAGACGPEVRAPRNPCAAAQNSCYWGLGATFPEDHCRLRVGDATENVSTLHGVWCDFAKALGMIRVLIDFETAGLHHLTALGWGNRSGRS
jgi:hypothetical protein